MHSHSKISDMTAKPFSLASSNSAFGAPMNEQKSVPQIGFKRSFEDRNKQMLS